jgi:hypothetical protein
MEGFFFLDRIGDYGFGRGLASSMTILMEDNESDILDLGGEATWFRAVIPFDFFLRAWINAVCLSSALARG